MSDTSGSNQPKRHRGPGRKWQPGQSGNPAGRPAGSGMSARFRAAVENDVLEIIQSLVARAKGGDNAAAALLAARVWPPLRPEAAPAELPGLNAGSLSERAQAALAAAGRGDLPIDRAADVIAALSGLARVREADEIEARLAALEKRIEGKP